MISSVTITMVSKTLVDNVCHAIFLINGIEATIQIASNQRESNNYLYHLALNEYFGFPSRYAQSEFEIEQRGNSLLPMVIDDRGVTAEVIGCCAMSGGADYQNEMPRVLTLFRRLADGSGYSMGYVQDPKRTPDKIKQDGERL